MRYCAFRADFTLVFDERDCFMIHLCFLVGYDRFEHSGLICFGWLHRVQFKARKHIRYETKKGFFSASTKRSMSTSIRYCSRRGEAVLSEPCGRGLGKQPHIVTRV